MYSFSMRAKGLNDCLVSVANNLEWNKVNDFEQIIFPANDFNE